jgi:hypothetical protein
LSRPFSYNDENFTVIGNILFVHFVDQKKRGANEPVIEVPYEIFRRLVSLNNSTVVSVNYPYYVSTIVPITVQMVGGKPFIAFSSERPVEPTYSRYYYCIYLLKDI